uniref:(northern house mosquito) hypothetical protein n=1 Tax=Culex pipiens TaxID=7175 RepID=A0A8D8BH37_CULPI
MKLAPSPEHHHPCQTFCDTVCHFFLSLFGWVNQIFVVAEVFVVQQLKKKWFPDPLFFFSGTRILQNWSSIGLVTLALPGPVGVLCLGKLLIILVFFFCLGTHGLQDWSLDR